MPALSKWNLLPVAALAIATATSSPGATISVPPGTSAVTVTGSTLTTQSNNFFVYHFVDAIGTITEGTSSVSAIPGGLPLNATFSIPVSASRGYATFVGLYSASGVAVALTSSAGAAALGQPFESVFTSATEANLVTAINLSSASVLISFLNANSTLFPQFTGSGTVVSAANVKFSNGTADGTLGVSILAGPAASATPEPSSLFLAAPVLLILVSLKKRLA